MAEKENDEEGWKFTASEDTSCKISLLVCTAGFTGRGHFYYPTTPGAPYGLLTTLVEGLCQTA